MGEYKGLQAGGTGKGEERKRTVLFGDNYNAITSEKDKRRKDAGLYRGI